MTLTVVIILCAVLLLGGSALLVVGWRGLRGRLPRNRYAGVRTPATLCSDEAFELGNRVAAPAILAAGGVSAVSGVVLPGLPSLTSVVVVAVLGLIGVVVLTGVGGVLGNRAASAMPEPQPSGGCGNCCCGGCG